MDVTHLTGFSDRLSPMLVKELRQGLRTRSFTGLFLTFQGMLAFILLVAGASIDSDGAGSFVSGAIFTLFAIAVLIFQPMRGVTALASEITGNTIEMMVLTRLSAWRIVFGKWIAIVSQSGLILTTIIPYLILRYFFGGMVFVGEIVFLALIFLTSMAFTAVMVGLSGKSTKLVRLVPILGIIFLMSSLPGFIRFGGGFKDMMNFFSLADKDAVIAVLGYISFITYIGWCALSHGTSVIAPAAENHSSIRRIIALALAGIVAGFSYWTDSEVLIILFAIILAPAVLTAVTEPTFLLPPLCKPFLKYGLPGRVAGLILLPGWPAGVFFTVLIVSISIAAILTSPNLLDPETSIISLALLGAFLLPALLTTLFSKADDKRLTSLMVFLLVLIIFSVVPAIFANMNNNEIYLWFFVWNPLVFLPMSAEPGIFDRQHLLIAIIALNAIVALALLITAGNAFRSYRETFRDSEDELTAAMPRTDASA
jgi:hypothetical protein